MFTCGGVFHTAAAAILWPACFGARASTDVLSSDRNPAWHPRYSCSSNAEDVEPMSLPRVPTTPAKTGPTVVVSGRGMRNGHALRIYPLSRPFLPVVVLFFMPSSSSSFLLTGMFGIQPLESQGWLAHTPAGRCWCRRGNGGCGFVVQVLQHLFDVSGEHERRSMTTVQCGALNSCYCVQAAHAVNNGGCLRRQEMLIVY